MVRRDKITFQYTTDNVNWTDYKTCHAYINGLSGNEFFVGNAGFDNALTVTIDCRYDPALMVIPTTYRAVDHNGRVYELVSPADDVKSEHKSIKFRARRVTV